MPEVRWAHMYPDQLEAAFAARPLLWLPQGLCEPHGPHCTLGLDALKADAIAIRAAQAHGGIVAPVDSWHVHEIGGYADWAHLNAGSVSRSWLTALPPWHHYKTVCYQVRQAEQLGFHAAIFLTGHYGPNWQDLKTLLSWLQPHCACRLYGLPDFEVNQPGFHPDRPGEGGDHAGRVETSLLWHLQPHCVDITRLPPPDAPGPHFCMGRSAPDADPAVGARMVADEVAGLGRIADSLLAAWTGRPDGGADFRFTTYSDVEQVWHDHIRPRLGELLTLQHHWGGDRPACPPDSSWAANRTIPDLLANGWG